MLWTDPRLQVIDLPGLTLPRLFFQLFNALTRATDRNMVVYGADKAVIVYIY
jgi:hypothetical protein